MLRTLGIFIILATSASYAFAQTDGFDVAIEKSGVSKYETRINFSAKNNTNRLAKTVFASCTAFDADTAPIKTFTGMINNLHPGEKAFGTITLVKEPEMKSASCRFSQASY